MKIDTDFLKYNIGRMIYTSEAVGFIDYDLSITINNLVKSFEISKDDEEAIRGFNGLVVSNAQSNMYPLGEIKEIIREYFINLED